MTSVSLEAPRCAAETTQWDAHKQTVALSPVSLVIDREPVDRSARPKRQIDLDRSAHIYAVIYDQTRHLFTRQNASCLARIANQIAIPLELPANRLFISKTK